ncbi:Laminin-like protein [Trichinella spiralis]|uniref:Laminin-like protein n=1 Tax=Trichinella spiralis TaxID=6334 RepID=A0ABR3K6R1_TRISP
MAKRRLARSLSKNLLLFQNPSLHSQLLSFQDLVSKRFKMLEAVERVLDKQALDEEVIKNLGKRFPEISGYLTEFLEGEKKENNVSTSLPKEQENLRENVEREYEKVESINPDEEIPTLVVEQKLQEFSEENSTQHKKFFEQKMMDVILNLQEAVEKLNNSLLKNEETKPCAVVHASTNTDDVELHEERTKMMTLYADLFNVVQRMGDDLKWLHEKQTMLHEQFTSLNDCMKAVEDLVNTVKNPIVEPVEVVNRDELRDQREAEMLELLSLKLEVSENSKQLKDIFSRLEDVKHIISSKTELMHNQLTSLVEETMELKRCRKQEIVQSAKELKFNEIQAELQTLKIELLEKQNNFDSCKRQFSADIKMLQKIQMEKDEKLLELEKMKEQLHNSDEERKRMQNELSEKAAMIKDLEAKIKEKDECITKLQASELTTTAKQRGENMLKSKTPKVLINKKAPVNPGNVKTAKDLGTERLNQALKRHQEVINAKISAKGDAYIPAAKKPSLFQPKFQSKKSQTPMKTPSLFTPAKKPSLFEKRKAEKEANSEGISESLIKSPRSFLQVPGTSGVKFPKPSPLSVNKTPVASPACRLDKLASTYSQHSLNEPFGADETSTLQLTEHSMNYEMTVYDSDDNPVDGEEQTKKVPTWANESNVQVIVERQGNDLFPEEDFSKNVDLKEMDVVSFLLNCGMHPSSSPPSTPPTTPTPPSDGKSTKASPLLNMVKTGVSAVRKQIEKSTALVDKKIQVEVMTQDIMVYLRSFASLESETEAAVKKLAKEEERQRKKAEFEAKKKEMLQKAIIHHRIIVAEPIQENSTDSSAAVTPSSQHVKLPASFNELIATSSFATAAASNGVSPSFDLSMIPMDKLLAILMDMRKEVAKIEHDAVKLSNYLDKNNLWDKVSSENAFYNWVVIQKNLESAATSPPAKKSKMQVKFENTVVGQQYSGNDSEK